MRYAGARHWAAPFVLAMLCLRAFIPAGFMLAPVDGQLRIVLCDTDARTISHHHPDDPAGQHHSSDPAAGHDHSSDPAAGHHHTQTDPTCPYAQSSGPAPLPALPAVAAVEIPMRVAAPVPVAQTHGQFGPVRQQSPRAPPHLA